MALPKKYSRKIVVGGTTYVWHLSQNSLELKEAPITIAQADAPRQFLHVDPFPALLGHCEITPRTIRRVILWALKNGWRPTERRSPLRIGYRDGEFIVLP